MVSQADVLSIFSRPDKEIRCEVADHVIPQGPLMDPERLQVTVQDGIVTLSARPGIIEAVRHIEGVAAVRDQLGPADDRLHTATS